MNIERIAALAASGESEVLEFKPMTLLNQGRGQVLFKFMTEEARVDVGAWHGELRKVLVQ